jgi:hypothetical protein
MLAENPTLRPLGFGVDVDALVRLPDTRQMTQRSEISQTVRRYVVGLSEDVRGHRQHGKTSGDRGLSNRMLADGVESSKSR